MLAVLAVLDPVVSLLSFYWVGAVSGIPFLCYLEGEQDIHTAPQMCAAAAADFLIAGRCVLVCGV